MYYSSSSDTFSLVAPGSPTVNTHQPKQLVKNWQVTETELGHGAFGSVFLGMNSDTGELIAVKRVNIETSDKDQAQVSHCNLDTHVNGC